MTQTVRPEPPILLIGIEKIAGTLGVSPGKLRGEYLKRRDFPARKERKTGPWITTRHSLISWAETYVTQRQG
jgi:hypothetical protein